jgi:hypothetical protein
MVQIMNMAMAITLILVLKEPLLCKMSVLVLLMEELHWVLAK